MFLHFGILLLLSPGLFGEGDDSEGLDGDTRIINGKDATPGMAPYQVSIRGNKNGQQWHSCGGSILNEEYVLTAAHCLVGKNKNEMLIVAGSHKLSKGGDVYKIKKIVPHEGYTKKYKNDIGVIQIDGKIKFNDKVQPITLLTEKVPIGKKCVLTGWGRNIYNKKSLPDNLQMLQFETISNDECTKKLKKSPYPSLVPIGKGQLCVKRPNDKGACFGDSGGPLVMQDEKNNTQQIGVVSWGVPCARDYPDVFASVTDYSDWIKKKMK